jgi:hypothetical protein
MISFNERSEREVRRLQQNNDIVKKEVEEIQNQIVSLEAIKVEDTEKNEEI